MPRSPGVHVQAVNKALGIAAGKLEEFVDLEDSFTSTNYPLLPALGVFWEEGRASQYSEDDLLWQYSELERDGIYGTPDGLWLGGDETAIWEAKFTTAKIKSIDQCWMYCKQGLCYAAMSGFRRVLYEVCWMLGDYSRPYKPKGTSTLVEFSDLEVESWWAIVLKSSRNVKPE